MGVVVVCLIVGPLVAFGVNSFVQGQQLQQVRSGSMKPFLPVGSLAVIEPVDITDIEAGQVVAFMSPVDPGRMVTHRVVEVMNGPDGVQLVTKGDANSTADVVPVQAQHLRGRLAYHVPNAGRALEFLQSPVGSIGLILVPAVALVTTEFWAWRRRRHWAGACPTCLRPEGPIEPVT